MNRLYLKSDVLSIGLAYAITNADDNSWAVLQKLTHGVTKYFSGC